LTGKFYQLVIGRVTGYGYAIGSIYPIEEDCRMRSNLLRYLAVGAVGSLVIGMTGCNSVLGPKEIGEEMKKSAKALYSDGMNFYYGNLHAHTKYSDGSGTPAEGFTWARDVANFDFYAITDHGEQLNSTEWNDLGNQANAFNQDGNFVALRGFEYSNALFGHINVLNTTSYTSSLRYWALSGFYRWLDKNNGLAQFNHPGDPSYAFNNMALSSSVVDNFYGIETANKPDGNVSNRYLPYYNTGLGKNWKIGAIASQDNHSLSSNSSRTVIIAPTLTRTDLLNALKAKRFYSSDDPSIQIAFRQGAAWMGSTVAGGAGNYQFTVSIEDNESIAKVELVTKSGAVAASQVYAAGQTVVLWEPTLSVSADTYYYVKVTETDELDDDPSNATQVIVSSPIWIDVQ